MHSKFTLIGGTAVMFIITIMILLRVLPGPHKSTDYLVIGTVATFVCLLAVFLILTTTGGRSSNMFYKRRK